MNAARASPPLVITIITLVPNNNKYNIIQTSRFQWRRRIKANRKSGGDGGASGAYYRRAISPYNDFKNIIIYYILYTYVYNSFP